MELNDLQFFGIIITQAITIGGLVLAWIRGAFSGGKLWERVTSSVDDHEERIATIEGSYMTVAVHAKEQAVCQERLTNAFLTAMERRDHALELKLIEMGRENDKKFSSICEGLRSIQSELKRQRNTHRKDDLDIL